MPWRSINAARSFIWPPMNLSRSASTSALRALQLVPRRFLPLRLAGLPVGIRPAGLPCDLLEQAGQTFGRAIRLLLLFQLAPDRRFAVPPALRQLGKLALQCKILPQFQGSQFLAVSLFLGFALLGRSMPAAPALAPCAEYWFSSVPDAGSAPAHCPAS